MLPPESVKQALKSRGKDVAKKVNDQAIQRLITYSQTGPGKVRLKRERR